MKIDIFRQSLHYILPKNRFGDKIYSLINFYFNHKKFPSKKKLFNDYLYKLKTTNEILNPLRIYISDKENVKKFINTSIGKKYNIPTYKILKKKGQILKYNFPSKCVIKPTHMSGEVIIRKKGEKINLNKILNWLTLNYYNRSREVNYKNLKPKIIVEKLLFNDDNLKDYKFFCYNGEPKIIQVDIDRYANFGKNHKRKFLDINWKDLKFSILYPRYKKKIRKPKNLNKMISIVRKLALRSRLGFIRIDTYSNDKSFYVGEMTNIHGNCSEHFFPKKSEKKASKIIFDF